MKKVYIAFFVALAIWYLAPAVKGYFQTTNPKPTAFINFARDYAQNSTILHDGDETAVVRAARANGIEVSSTGRSQGEDVLINYHKPRLLVFANLFGVVVIGFWIGIYLKKLLAREIP